VTAANGNHAPKPWPTLRSYWGGTGHRTPSPPGPCACFKIPVSRLDKRHRCARETRFREQFTEAIREQGLAILYVRGGARPIGNPYLPLNSVGALVHIYLGRARRRALVGALQSKISWGHDFDRLNVPEPNSEYPKLGQRKNFSADIRGPGGSRR